MPKRRRDSSEILPPTWAQDDRPIENEQDRVEARLENMYLIEQLRGVERSCYGEAGRGSVIIQWREKITKKLASAEPNLGRYANVEDSIQSIQDTMMLAMKQMDILNASKEAVVESNRKKIDEIERRMAFLNSFIFSLAQEQTHNARTGLLPDADSSQEGVASDPDLTATPIGLASSGVADAADQQCVGCDSGFSATPVGLPSTDAADAVTQERVGGQPRLGAIAVGSASSVHSLSAAAGGSANSVVAHAVSVSSAFGARAMKVDSSVDGGRAAASNRKRKEGSIATRRRKRKFVDVIKMIQFKEWSNVDHEVKVEALQLCTVKKLRSLVLRVKQGPPERKARKERLVTLLMSMLKQQHVHMLISELGAGERPAANQEKGAYQTTLDKYRFRNTEMEDTAGTHGALSLVYQCNK